MVVPSEGQSQMQEQKWLGRPRKIDHAHIEAGYMETARSHMADECRPSVSIYLDGACDEEITWCLELGFQPSY